MTMISQYYAKVGVDTDRKSLSSVDSYLGSIERKFQGFQRKLRRGNHFKLEFSGNEVVKSLNKSLRKGGGQRASLDLGRVSFKHDSLIRSLNNSLKKASAAGRELGIDAKLSGASLQNIRRQLRELTAVLNVNANVRGTTTGVGSGFSTQTGLPNQLGADRRFPHNVKREDPTGNRSMSKYYNPIMMGGASGAIARYGMHALPLYGGVLGINSMVNKAAINEQQVSQLRSTIDVYGGTGNLENYLKNLETISDNLAVQTGDLIPNFTEAIGAWIGTPIEDAAVKSFNEVTKLTVSMGLNAKDTSETLSAFTNMFLTQKSTGGRFQSTRSEKLPPVVQIAADALYGGDTRKMFADMREERIDVKTAIPIVLAEMNKRSKSGLDRRFEQLTYQRDRLGKVGDDFFTRVMGSGGEKGLTMLYRALSDSLGDADIGKFFGNLLFKATKAASLFTIGISDIIKFRMTGEWGEDSIGDYFGDGFKTAVENLFKIHDVMGEVTKGFLTLMQFLANKLGIINIKVGAAGGDQKAGTRTPTNAGTTESKQVRDTSHSTDNLFKFIPDIGSWFSSSRINQPNYAERSSLYVKESGEQFKKGGVQARGRYAAEVQAINKAHELVTEMEIIKGVELKEGAYLSEVERVRQEVMQNILVRAKEVADQNGDLNKFWDEFFRDKSTYAGVRKGLPSPSDKDRVVGYRPDLYNEKGEFIGNPSDLPQAVGYFINSMTALAARGEEAIAYQDKVATGDFPQNVAVSGSHQQLSLPELGTDLINSLMKATFSGAVEWAKDANNPRKPLLPSEEVRDRVFGRLAQNIEFFSSELGRYQESIGSATKGIENLGDNIPEAMREFMSGVKPREVIVNNEIKFDSSVVVNSEGNFQDIADDLNRWFKGSMDNLIQDVASKTAIAVN